MKFILSILVAVLTSISAFAQNPTSVYWLKSRVTDSTTVSYPTGWGVFYYNAQSAKWRICNGAGVCKDVGTGGGGISSVAWGDITGVISDQTDLQDSLSDKRALKTKRREFTSSHTIQAADAERIIFMNSASSNNYTVAPNSSVAIPLYTTIWISQTGAGVTTVVEGGGVTVTPSSGSLIAPAQNALMMLYKTGTDTWLLFNGTAILPIDLTTDVVGILPYTNGGTGLSTLGTSGQSIRVNAGETGYEFYTPSVGSGTVTSVATTAPITGGTITTTGTIGITQSTTSTNGYLSSTDWNTFNGKQNSITFGTGVLTALGVNIGSAGAPVLFNGALGTPSSGTATNLTGTASGLTAGNVTTNANMTGDVTSVGNATTLATVNSNVGTFGSATLAPILTVNGKGLVTAVSTATITPTVGSITGLGTSVATWLATPSSANLAAALTDEAGSSGGFTRADYVDAKVEDAINDGEITKAPTENIVYDNLLLKADKASKLTDLASGPTALKNIGGIERAAVANNQTGTTYTLLASDFSTFTKLYLSNASSQTVTIPLNSVTPIPAGVTLLGRRRGAGAVTFTIAGGGTIVSTSGSNLDPGVDQLFALTKREGTTDTWDLDNGGVPLGAANQILGVNTGATAQEYKTVSNGLTSASGTFKLGGAFTADTQFSGAFSLGIGAAPTSKFHVTGLGTTTGGLFLYEDNSGTDRAALSDNGTFTHAATLSGTGTLGFSSTITTSSTANNQTLGGYDFVLTPSYGANTGVTLNAFRIRSTSGVNDFFNIVQSSSGTATVATINVPIFNVANSSSTAILRNAAAAISFRGGTASTTRCVQFATTVANSTNNNAAFNFTGNTHDLTSGVTRTFTGILNDASISSVNGSTITYSIFDNSPSFAIGTSTATVTGYNYNPTFTSGTFTHYAMRVQSGLSAFGHTNTPTAFMDLAASTTGSATLRIRSGSAPTSPNDGEVWQDGTNYFARGGSTTYTLAKTLTNTATLDFPNTTAGTQSDLTITVTGAADGDNVIIGVPNGSVSGTDNVSYWGWVSSANTVTIRFNNANVVSAVDPASGTFRASVIKY
jgi:hypothetical protein